MALVTDTAPPPRDVPARIDPWTSFLAAYEHFVLLYRRIWRGSIIGNFVTPVLFLLAMGVGLGGFVDRAGTDAMGGVPYLTFLAPGLLASVVMQSSSFDATFPIIGGFHWVKRYHAMVATQLTPTTIALAQLAWIATRATLVATVFTVVMFLFGAARSPAAILGVPVATLTGMAFAGPIAAFMTTQRDTNAFMNIWRFGITPLFLFGGTFFPIERLPDVIRPVAWLFPLWHGADLARALSLGTIGEAPLLHLAHVVFLVLVAAAGVTATVLMFRRRLGR